MFPFHISKKSQVMLLIIIGVIILVVSSIFLVVFSITSQSFFSIGSARVSETDIAFNQINTYLQVCLDNALEQGLYIIGRQGGFIFQHQPESILPWSVPSAELRTEQFPENVFNVTFISEGSVPPYFQSVPGYPCLRPEYVSQQIERIGNVHGTDSVIGNLTLLNGTRCQRYYNHTIPEKAFISFGSFTRVSNVFLNVPLCNEAQWLNISGVRAPVCSTPGGGLGRYSIQSQLEHFVQYRMEDCFDSVVPFITQDLQADIIEKGEIEPSLIFGESFTEVVLRFPLVLNFTTLGGSSSSVDLRSQVPVRFKTIYGLLYGQNVLVRFPDVYAEGTGIIGNDLSFLPYKINRDAYEKLNEFGLEDITIERRYDQYGSYVRVIDEASSLKGHPYEYFVRMKLRPPALNALRGSLATGTYDYVFYANGTLFIEPLAFDPDDSALRYEYEILNGDWQWRQEYLHNNTLFRTGRDDDMECRHPLYGVTSGRCTRIELNDSDVGSHRIRVFATNAAGFSDYQDIRVFVDTDQRLNVTVRLVYDYVREPISILPKVFNDRTIISRDAPFVFNLSASVLSDLGTSDHFTWEDIVNNVSVRFETDEEIIAHYNATDYVVQSNFSDFIDTFAGITNDAFIFPTIENRDVILRLDDLLPFLRIFNVTASYQYPLEDKSVRESTLLVTYYRHNNPLQFHREEVYFVDCVPYRSTIVSYPYSTMRRYGHDRLFNPFEANHTCCAGDPSDPSTWKLLDEGSPCFDEFFVGTYHEFMIDPTTNISNELFRRLDERFDVFNINSDGNSFVVLKPTAGAENLDQYRLTLYGECDGTTGVVCWPKNYTIQKYPYCGQIEGPDAMRQIGSPVSSVMLGSYPTYTIYNRDFKIVDTDLSHNDYGDGYYLNDYCLCAEDGFPSLINMTNPEENSGYCCFNEQGFPERISQIPCHLQECRRAPVDNYHSFTNNIRTLELGVSQNVSTTVFLGEGSYPDLQRPGPLCQCGADPTAIINTSDPASYAPGDEPLYCCNPYGTFELLPFSECNDGVDLLCEQLKYDVIDSGTNTYNFANWNTYVHRVDGNIDPNFPSPQETYDGISNVPSYALETCPSFCSDNTLYHSGSCVSNNADLTVGCDYQLTVCSGNSECRLSYDYGRAECCPAERVGTDFSGRPVCCSGVADASGNCT